MKFKEWVEKNTDFGCWIVEFLDVANMATSDIELKKATPSEFDYDSAQESCRESVSDYFDTSDYLEGVYDSVEEDPNFFDDYGVIEPEIWLEDNPEPDQEEEPEEYEKWKDEYENVKESYDDAIERWERNMRSKRREAEQSISDAMDEAIDECVESTKQEWEDENESSADVQYNFTIGSDNFEVSFNKGSEYVSGFNIPDIWDITFEGPSGYSTTNKNKNATLIYKQLLLSVKKLLETEKVNGVTFTPAEPAMALVYNQFYKQFLSNDFIRVQTFTLVKKEVVREILEGKWGGSEVSKNRFKTLILNASREARMKLQQIKQQKATNRDLVKNVPIGKFVQIDTTMGPSSESPGSPAIIPMIVLGVSQRHGSVFYLVGQVFKKREQGYGYDALPKTGNIDFSDLNKFHFEITDVAPQGLSKNDNIGPELKRLMIQILKTQYPGRYQSIANYLN